MTKHGNDYLLPHNELRNSKSIFSKLWFRLIMALLIFVAAVATITWLAYSCALPSFLSNLMKHQKCTTDNLVNPISQESNNTTSSFTPAFMTPIHGMKAGSVNSTIDNVEDAVRSKRQAGYYQQYPNTGFYSGNVNQPWPMPVQPPSYPGYNSQNNPAFQFVPGVPPFAQQQHPNMIVLEPVPIGPSKCKINNTQNAPGSVPASGFMPLPFQHQHLRGDSVNNNRGSLSPSLPGPIIINPIPDGSFDEYSTWLEKEYNIKKLFFGEKRGAEERSVSRVAVVFSKMIEQGINLRFGEKKDFQVAGHNISFSGKMDSYFDGQADLVAFSISIDGHPRLLISLKSRNPNPEFHPNLSPGMLKTDLVFKMVDAMSNEKIWMLTEHADVLKTSDPPFTPEDAKLILTDTIMGMKSIYEKGYMFPNYLCSLALYTKSAPESGITGARILDTGIFTKQDSLTAQTNVNSSFQALGTLVADLAGLEDINGGKKSKIFVDIQGNATISKNINSDLLDLYLLLTFRTEHPPKTFEELLKHPFISGKPVEGVDPYGKRDEPMRSFDDQVVYKIGKCPFAANTATSGIPGQNGIVASNSQLPIANPGNIGQPWNGQPTNVNQYGQNNRLEGHQPGGYYQGYQLWSQQMAGYPQSYQPAVMYPSQLPPNWVNPVVNGANRFYPTGNQYYQQPIPYWNR